MGKKIGVVCLLVRVLGGRENCSLPYSLLFVKAFKTTVLVRVNHFFIGSLYS
jgi:hypothetical protein